MADQAEHEPVTIVGVGLAGLAAAIVPACVGRQVVAREWHRDVGSRFHGDFQSIKNWSGAHDVLTELEDAGIAPTFPVHPVQRGTAFDARGGQHTVQCNRPLFYVVSRGGTAGLEHNLLRQAIDCGTVVRFADRVEAVHGPAILAGGPRTADIIAAGYIFYTDRADNCFVAFDDRLAPLEVGQAYQPMQEVRLERFGRSGVSRCWQHEV